MDSRTAIEEIALIKRVIGDSRKFAVGNGKHCLLRRVLVTGAVYRLMWVSFVCVAWRLGSLLMYVVEGLDNLLIFGVIDDSLSDYSGHCLLYQIKDQPSSGRGELTFEISKRPAARSGVLRPLFFALRTCSDLLLF